MEEELKLACNRLPFKGDSACDRGEVDTSAFLEFPVCQLIDPTKSKSATIQVDFPVIPFSPPPCACVAVDVVPVNLSVEDREGLYVDIDFKSVGDCCEGNYEADLDVRIPCIPFKIETKGGGGSDSGGNVAIDLNCYEDRPSGKFSIGLEVESCTLSLNPSLELHIPCIPFEIAGGSDSHAIGITTDCSTEEPSGTFNLGLTVDCCTLSINPTMDLKIPTPKEVDFSMKVNMHEIDCGSSGASSESPGGSCQVAVRTEDCKKHIDTTLNLRLPHVANVTAGSAGELNLTGDLGGSGTFDLGATTDACGFLTGFCPSIDLNLPCPIDGSDIALTANIGWGNKPTSTATLATIDACKLNCTSGELNLALPCPIQGDIGFSIKVDWDGDQEAEAVLAEAGESCTLTGVSPTLNIGLPCPAQGENITLNASISWGTKQSDTTTLAEIDEDSCTITGKTGSIDLQLPCPLDGLELIGIYPVRCTRVDTGGCGAVWYISLAGVDPDPGAVSAASFSSSYGSAGWSSGRPFPGSSSIPAPAPSSSPHPGPVTPSSSGGPGPEPTHSSSPSGCTSVEFDVSDPKPSEYVKINTETLFTTKIIKGQKGQGLYQYSIEAKYDDCCITGASIGASTSGLSFSVDIYRDEHCQDPTTAKKATITIVCDASKISDDDWIKLCGTTITVPAVSFHTTCDSSPSHSSGGGGGSGSGGECASFSAVTGVSCSSAGGIDVEMTTFTIDFDNRCVRAEKVTGGGNTPEEAALARDLLTATVRAIQDDPSILSIIENPGSVSARRALSKLGIG